MQRAAEVNIDDDSIFVAWILCGFSDIYFIVCNDMCIKLDLILYKYQEQSLHQVRRLMKLLAPEENPDQIIYLTLRNEYSPFKYAKANAAGDNLLEVLYNSLVDSNEQRTGNNEDQGIIHTATKLRNVGIKFVSVSSNQLFTSIEFRDDTIYLPTIHLYHERSEIILRNLVAHEMCCLGRTPVQSYLLFMDYLIDDVLDVEILMKKGVIVNKMGSNGQVVELFNHLTKGFSTGINNELGNIMNNVNIRYRHKWKGLWAKFCHSYFDNYVQGTISVVVFIVTMGTLVQSIYAVLSYHHPTS